MEPETAASAATPAPTAEVVGPAPTPPNASVRPVVLRLLLVAVAAVCIVHLVSSLVIASFASRAEERERETRLAMILDSHAQLMAAPLWKLQYEILSLMLNELVLEQTITSGSVYDDAGAVVATTKTAGPPSPPGAAMLHTAPIVYQNGNIRVPAGRLQVEVERATVIETFWHSLWQTLLIVSLATAAIAAGIWYATQQYIGRPLSLIAAAIDRSRRDGRRHRVAWESDDEFGAVARAFNAMQDAAERNEQALQVANRRLDFLALHDELTSLPNRRSFEERLRRAALDVDPEGGTLAVHFVDLDDFKAVNDTLGHTAGDRLLRHVGRQLRAVIGPDDFVARFGGDEFVVLQSAVRKEADAHRFAEVLMTAIGQPVTLHNTTVRAAASIGVALLDGDHSDVPRLLSLADIALYEAKRGNRGTISFLTDAGRNEHDRRRKLERDIKIALEQRQFLLHFQPQVRLDTGAPIGLEALLRWQHPHDGLIGPAEFLPLIEELGLARELGSYVLEEACEAARRLRDRGHRDLRMAVNLAGEQIVDPGLIRLFRDQMTALALPAGALEAEITEVALIRDPSNARKTIVGLRALGVSIALDDFGTGYSSLAYLRHFPVDRIKLDRSFVRELPEYRETIAIVRAVCGLSQALGAEIVAEGIETEAEASFLRDEGVPLAQGYLYCRPAPLDDICVWLEARRQPVSHAA